ncbi:hypothetical protein TNCV_3621981 [Trichonephila clavipes]|nr:hypothetical protein TNCV_3621981 [Trichonephila clavipes]
MGIVANTEGLQWYRARTHDAPATTHYLEHRVTTASCERQSLQTTIFMQDGIIPHIRCQVKALIIATCDDNRDYLDIFWMHGILAHPTCPCGF